MAGAAIAGRLGTRLGPHKLIITGSSVAIVAAAMIIVLHGLNVTNGLAVALPALFWMLGHGLHYPQSMAAAVAPFPENAGAASSLIGFYQTTAGAIAAVTIGALHDGTAMPLGGLMLGLSVAALVAYTPFYRRYLKSV